MKSHVKDTKPNRIRQAISVLLHGLPWAEVKYGDDIWCVDPGAILELDDRMAPLRCPFCFHDMKRSDRKEDWHVDPTGHAQYSCTNDNCHDRPRYRRVDVLDAAMDQQAQSRADKQAQEHEAFERLTAMENRLTTWMRERYKGHFRGQFESIAEIAIFVMSNGKDGRISNPLSGDPPATPPTP